MKRVIVIGTTGSGKTTLAKKIAEKLNCPHIQIDSLFWKPNWQEATDEELFAKIEEAVFQESWVLDGLQSESLEALEMAIRTAGWLKIDSAFQPLQLSLQSSSPPEVHNFDTSTLSL